MNLRAPATVLVALSHMTWSQLQARTADGVLPALSRLMARGVRLRVAPLAAEESAGLWPTIATGLGAEQHGIASHNELWTGGLRPAGRQSWRAAPFWEWFEAADVSTMSVAWPQTAPGAAWSGVQVDERLALPTGAGFEEWFVPREVAPERLREALREVRVHPTDIEAMHLRPFVPALDGIDQHRDKRLIDLALPLARFSTDYAAFGTLAERERPQIATLFVRLLGDLLAGFENAEAPFDGVIDAAWTLLDQMIGTLSQGLPEDGTFILFSPGRSGESGVTLAAGPGLPADTELPAMSPIDLIPSLLARYGFADERLPGKPRLNAPPQMRSLAPEWTAMTVPEPDANDLARVAEHGFTPKAPHAATLAAHFSAQAEALLQSDPAAARKLAEKALKHAPESALALGTLAASLAATGDFAALAPLADRLEKVAPDHIWVPLMRGGHHAAEGNAEAAKPLLLEVEEKGRPLEWMRAAAAWLMLGSPEEARRLFAMVLEEWPDSTDALLGLAMTIPAWSEEAEKVLRRALSLQPDSAAIRERLREVQVQLSIRSARSP